MLRDQRDWLLNCFAADTDSEDRDFGAGIVELLDHILDIAEGHEPNVSVTNITAAVDVQIVKVEPTRAGPLLGEPSSPWPSRYRHATVG